MGCTFTYNSLSDNKKAIDLLSEIKNMSEKELDDFIKNKWTDVISILGNKANILFSYERTVADTLEDARNEAKEAFKKVREQRLVQLLDGEDDESYEDDYDSVTDWIRKNKLSTGINRKAYRDNTENKLFPNETKEERDEEYRKIFAGWSYTRQVGRGMHIIAEHLIHSIAASPNHLSSAKVYNLTTAKEYITGKEAPNGQPFTLDGISEEAMLDFIKGVNKIARQITAGTKIYTEFPIQSTLSDSKLRGSIDLVTVDPSGNVTIYDIKLSSTPVEQWDRDRIDYIYYQQELYKRLLASKGIPREKIITKIIPITYSMDVSNLEERNDEVVNTKDNLDVIRGIVVNDIQNVTLDASQLFKLNKLLPYDIDEVQTTECFNTVKENMSKYFQGSEIVAEKVSPENIPIRTTRDGTKYYIINEITQERIVRDTKEELEEYINKEYKNARETGLNDLTIGLTKELKDTCTELNDPNHNKYKRLTLRSILGKYQNKERNDYITTLFSKYTYERGWKVIEDPDLLRLHVVMLVNTVTRAVDLVSLENANLDRGLNLSKGTTLLGAFYEDNNPNLESQAKNRLLAKLGNYKIIELLEIASAKMKGQFQDYYIEDLTVYNPEHNQSYRPVVFGNYIENFNTLRKKVGLDTCKLQQISELIRFKKAYEDILLSPGVSSSIEGFGKNRMLGDTNSMTLSRLQELLKDFRNSFYYAGRDYKPDGSLESYLYAEISRAIVRLSNIQIDPYNYNALSTWFGNMFESKNSNIKVNRAFGNSLKLNTADTIELYEPIKEALNKTRYNIRSRYTAYKKHARDPYIAFKKESVYSNKFVNLSEKEYSQLIDQSEQGLKEFRFKDPETDSTLTAKQKKFLEWYLNDINKLRFGEQATTEEGIKKLKEEGKWYWVPIMKAQTASRLVNHEGGLIKSLSSNLSDELINRRQIVDEENLVSYKESENNDFTEFFNLFSSTTSSLENRLQIIENARKDENGNLRNPLSVFESNLETVCDTAHLASIREGEYNKILPTIQANLTMLQLISYISSNKDIEKTIQYIKDNIKTTVLDMPLIGTEGQQLYKVLFGLKKITSALILGGNLRSGLKETATSFFRLYTRATANSLTDKTRIGLKDMMWAYGTVWKDAMHQITTLTKLEELNMFFGMANMSEEELVQRMNFYQSDPMRVMTNMFWACRAPDFLNRTTILVGYMKKYGCWDAYEEDKEGHYKYNWHKDKRFSLLTKYNPKNSKDVKDSSIPEADKKEYLYQKALYNTMLERFVNQDYMIIDKDGNGRSITMNDDLPQAFTDAETASMKRESDALFGYMDNDNKSEIFKGGILAIIGHFKTYLTAIKDQWFVSRGSHFEGYWAQDTDGDGNKIYNQLNDDGTYERTANEKNASGELNQPAISWHGRITEGIFWSIMDTCITPWFSLRDGNCMKAFRKAWSDPVKQRNMLIGAQEALIIWLLMLLLRFAFGDIKLGKINDTQRFMIGYVRDVRNDLNVVQTLGQGLKLNAPSWDFVSNVSSDMWDAIVKRKLNPGRVVIDNLGITRPYKSYIDKFLPNPKYNHTAINDLIY